MMKKTIAFFILAVVAAVSLIFPAGGQSATAAEAAAFDMENNEIYLILKDFVQTHPKRSAFSQEEKAAAAYIEEQFADAGLADVRQLQFNYGTDSSQNVGGRIYASSITAKTVIIGAHYDNDVNGASDGTFDNGGGVASLIYIARRLADAELPFNVDIVAFGAEEYGMIGSYFYVAQTLDAENTLLFVNIDMIAGGDMLYAYGEDVRTDFEDFFVEASEKAGVAVPLRNMPGNKRVTTMFAGASGLPYFHAAQNSDQVYFRNAGVPSLLIFSGNMSSKYFGFVEAESYPGGLSHTANDNLEFFKATFGNSFVDKMQSVADTVVAALSDSAFADVAQNAEKELVSDVWRKTGVPTIVFAVILAALVVWGILYYKKLVKDSILGDGVANGKKFFSKSDVEDIFDFKDKRK